MNFIRAKIGIFILLSSLSFPYAVMAANTWSQPTKAIVTSHQDGTPIDQVVSAPVPAALATAKKVFIANLGGDDTGLGDDILATGETYNHFYSAITTWNHFVPVGTPSDADLVLEIRFLPRVIEKSPTELEHACIQLVIVDPSTHIPLWTITEALDDWTLTSTGIKNYNLAMNKLMDDFKMLVQRASLTNK